MTSGGSRLVVVAAGSEPSRHRLFAPCTPHSEIYRQKTGGGHVLETPAASALLPRDLGQGT